MSITLNNSDFQCLQDQLLDLKNKNYELAERNRRGQADFEAAKAKICSLQLKLEEQERDFQVTSTTLRREIEAATSSNYDPEKGSCDDQIDYKSENKKLALRIEELEQHQAGSTEIMQQMDAQNKILDEKVRELEEAQTRLKEQLKAKDNEFDVIKEEFERKLNSTITEYKSLISEGRKKHTSKLEAINLERNQLKVEVDKLTDEAKGFSAKFESQVEERKLQDRKGLKLVKELKRQLALEKTKSATLQKRLEHLLSELPVPAATSVSSSDLDDASRSRMSTSSSTNDGNGSQENNSSNGGRANQDSNSVGSWSFVQSGGGAKTPKSNNRAVNEALSICSIDSEDRETVQQPIVASSTSEQPNADDFILSTITSNTPTTTPDASSSISAGISPPKPDNTLVSINNDDQLSLQSRIDDLKQSLNTPIYATTTGPAPRDGLLIEEQAALVERLTKMQHEKWVLEEKLSYMEQANSSLTEDLANKSGIIKHYLMEQALKPPTTPSSISSLTGSHRGGDSITNPISPTSYSNYSNNLNSRRTSFPTNVNHLLSDRPSLKKVVDFLKERGQISLGDSENVPKEAMKKMQLMLEETLIKCLKLQENLDFVTSELNKVKN